MRTRRKQSHVRPLVEINVNSFTATKNSLQFPFLVLFVDIMAASWLTRTAKPHEPRPYNYLQANPNDKYRWLSGVRRVDDQSSGQEF